MELGAIFKKTYHLYRLSSKGSPKDPVLIIRCGVGWRGEAGTEEVCDVPFLHSGSSVTKTQNLTLLQEPDVPHGLGRGPPLERQVSLPGLVRVGDCVSLFKASYQFGMRRNGDKSASYLMIRHSSGLE